MRETNSNRARMLADVVYLDAWHQPLQKGRQRVAVFTNLLFDEGRLGGDISSPVTFRLSLRRAELVVMCGNEPVRIVKSTLKRRSIPLPVKAKVTSKSDTRNERRGKASLSNKGMSVEGAVTAKTAESIQVEYATALSMAGIDVAYMPDGAGNDRWLLRPTAGDRLSGPATDEGEAFFEIADLRRDPDKGIEPSIAFELRCKKEDLLITDIKLKDDGLMERFRNAVGFENKMKAAEAYIRTKLYEMGLGENAMDTPFADIRLAVVVARNE
jgi:hypothetical protein